MIKLATRQSPLAMLQCHLVANALQARGIQTDIVPMSTMGDEIQDRPLHEVGGKELFIKTLQQALIEKRADVAVHSLKDMASTTHPDFTLAAVGFAEDARDVLISERYDELSSLPAGAIVGTCSPRRTALLSRYHPHLKIVSIRGNLQTRLGKISNGECDAIILAAAGLNRLGQSATIKQYLPPEQFIPAVGQGLLALECRQGDDAVINQIAAIAALGNPKDMLRAEAERTFASQLHADCTTPLGAHATVGADGMIKMRAFYQTEDGRYLEAEAEAEPEAKLMQAQQLGMEVAKIIRQQIG